MKEKNRTQEVQRSRDNLAHHIRDLRHQWNDDIARVLLENKDKYEGSRFNKEVAIKLIWKWDRGREYLNNNLEIFDRMDKEAAEILIDKWYARYVADNLEKFEWLNHKEFAEELIDRVYWEYVAKNIDKFKWVDKNEIAEKILNWPNWWCLSYYLENFEWLDHKEVAKILISKWYSYRVGKNLKFFKWLDKEIAEKLIRWKNWYFLARDLESFEWLDKGIAEKLVRKADSEPGGYLCQAVREGIVKNLEKFDWLNTKEFVKKYLLWSNFYPELIEQYKEKFEWLDEEIANELIEDWYSEFVAKNLEKFEWLDEATLRALK